MEKTVALADGVKIGVRTIGANMGDPGAVMLTLPSALIKQLSEPSGSGEKHWWLNSQVAAAISDAHHAGMLSQ